MHTVDYNILYLIFFRKQKVQLVANAFNDKVTACFKLNSLSDTAYFGKLVTQTWKFLNI